MAIWHGQWSQESRSAVVQRRACEDRLARELCGERGTAATPRLNRVDRLSAARRSRCGEGGTGMEGVKLPKLSWQDLVLEPERSVTRGESSDARQLAGLITLGGPLAVQITAADIPEDNEAGSFMKTRIDNFSFYLVHFACAFRPADGEPFLTVRIQMRLERGDGVEEPRPIALSMKPIRLEEPVELSRTLKLGGSLKILDASVEEQEKRTIKQVFLEGLNELRADPLWEFHETRLTQIRGSQRFILVIQEPKRAAGRGTIAVSATISRKRFGVLPYRATLPDQPEVSFVL